MNRNQRTLHPIGFASARLSAAGLSPRQVAAALAVVGGTRRALGQQGRPVGVGEDSGGCFFTWFEPATNGA